MKWVIISLVFLVLFSGCLGEKGIDYVCYDGQIVSKPRDCPEVEKPSPERIIVREYVCPDGRIVNGSEDCGWPNTSQVITTTSLGTSSTISTSTTTSSTTQATTTTLTTSTTVTTTTTAKETTSTTTTTMIAKTDDSCVNLGCPAGTEFVGSKNSDKYHYCNCRYARNIKAENIVCFSDKEETQEEDYVPCGICQPDG